MNPVGYAETAVLRAALRVFSSDYALNPDWADGEAASHRLALAARALVTAVDQSETKPAGWEAYQPASARGEAALQVLTQLVRLKDGPRDDAYQVARVQAWAAARALVGVDVAA